MDSTLLVYDEGNRIILDVPHKSVRDDEEAEEEEEDTFAPPKEQVTRVPDKRASQTHTERLMGVRNKQCENMQRNKENALELEFQQAIDMIRKEEYHLRYRLKIMQVDQHRNRMEQNKRHLVDLDTTFDELLIKQATKYLIVDPEDVCYLKKSNHFPARVNTLPGQATPLVSQARKVLQDIDVQRQVGKIQAKQEEARKQSALSTCRAPQADGDEEDIPGQLPSLLQSDQDRQSQQATAAIVTNQLPEVRPSYSQSRKMSSGNLGPRSHTTVAATSLPTVHKAQPPQLGKRSQSFAGTSRECQSATGKQPITAPANLLATFADLDDDDDYEYDNENIMRKLRKAGIIKQTETVDFKRKTIEGALTGKDASLSAHVVRKPLTLDMLKEDNERIQKRMQEWYFNVEVQKRRERNQHQAQQQLQLIEAEEERKRQAQPKWGTMTSDDKKKINLMTSFRSKVMREKWQSTTAKMQIHKSEANWGITYKTESNNLSTKSADNSRPSTANTTGNRSTTSDKPVQPGLSLDYMPYRLARPGQPMKKESRHAIHTRRRSETRSLSSRLSRMVQDILANKSTYQLMEYDKIRQNLNAGKPASLEAIPEKE